MQTEQLSFVVDSGPDFRQQMLREQITNLDAILFTHDHKDHTAGLDDVRAFNHIQNKAMQVYAEDYVLDTLKREFAYAFTKHKYPGVPNIELNPIQNKSFSIENEVIEPIRGMHLKLPVLGFKIRNFAYITDMNYISDEEMKKIQNIDVLVINALRTKKHISHFNLEEALDVIKKAKVKQAYLTHISHALGDYKILSKQLPSNVKLAFDGLILEV